MTAKPTVSVVVCTYTERRWDDLVEAVASLRSQSQPPDEIVVVVDHNPALLARARQAMPDVQVVENSGQQGLSGARNSGSAAARGSLIAFLDDDAVADRDCLARQLAWCAQPNVLGAGGRVDPIWLSPRPGWFPEEFDWVVGCSYRGLPERAAPVRNLFGGCMMLRREVLEAVGGFRTDLGRVGALPAGCEETELCIRARQQAPQGVFIYEPQSVIGHKVTAARLRVDYFLARCRGEGVSKARVAAVVGAQDGLSTERGYVWRTLPRGVGRGLADLVVRRDIYGAARAAMIGLGLTATALGYAQGLWQDRLAKHQDGHRAQPRLRSGLGKP
jgi:GT2 family glycosyltransferase